MSFIGFLQVLANVIFAVGLFVVFARLRRPAKDDPRLSKGLQLLSSKIAVLEDLSDRTETQVQQMLALLDQKSKELQAKVALADQQVVAIRQSMDQSLEVAQIFQDKIPHNEIIERQNSMKYIRAARMAHAGASVTDIAREVDLPMGEIEFIAKVNRENLSFREEDLPAWARDPNAMSASNIDHLSLAASVTPTVQEQMPVPMEGPLPALNPEQEGLVQKLSKLQFEMKNLDLELAHRASRGLTPDLSQAFEPPRMDSSSLEKLGEEFRRAVDQAGAPTNGHGHAGNATASARESARGSVRGELHWPTHEEPAAIQPPAKPAPMHSAGASATPTIAREISNPELEAARAAAASLRAKEAPVSVQTLNGPQTVTKTVRRVEFPRI